MMISEKWIEILWKSKEEKETDSKPWDFVNKSKTPREIILFSSRVMILSILSMYTLKHSFESYSDAKKPVFNVPF